VLAEGCDDGVHNASVVLTLVVRVVQVLEGEKDLDAVGSRRVQERADPCQARGIDPIHKVAVNPVCVGKDSVHPGSLYPSPVGSRQVVDVHAQWEEWLPVHMQLAVYD
jgi:hypothetical protein